MDIIIRGAKEHNLKNIDLTIPRNKLTVFVGVSGSGKSTIAFDIIAREGQRQYFESLSAFARRYLQKSNRPEAEEINGISSTIIIGQDRVAGNPRSTVGTISQAYTYLRLLFSRCGWPVFDSNHFSFNHPYGACPKCKGLGRAVEVDKEKVIDTNLSLNEGAIIPGDWYVGGRQWNIIKASGYFDMDKKLRDFRPEEMDKLLFAKPEMLQSVSQGFIDRWTFQGVVHRIIHRNSKVHRGLSERDMKYFKLTDCQECYGWRLNEESLAVELNGLNIGQVAKLPLGKCLEFVRRIDHKHAAVIKPQLENILKSLIGVGLGYLSLDRSADTLSGGEAQRVKIARQLGCDLVETIYVLDEPTAGLHPRDVATVIDNLMKLREKGNTVLVVEHDPEVIRNAEQIVEIGPGGGRKGGNIIFSGTYDQMLEDGRSLTGKYLKRPANLGNHGRVTPGSLITRQPNGWLPIRDASGNNLKNINIDLPLGIFTSLTGVSGSGKSSLIEEIVRHNPGKATLIDQSPVGANRRGCIATYVGAFDEIRKVFSEVTGVGAGKFSYNSGGGCPECKGAGIIDMDMNFLGNVKIKCGECKGNRYRKDVLKHRYKGVTIADVLRMTALEATNLFEQKNIRNALDMLTAVGLDYVEMGQTLDTLSGGESQRLKLASRLQCKGEFYILDEPTTGLHFADIDKLMRLLNMLVDNGNTVLVVEHNVDVIKASDWIIDMGPEGGEEGGQVLYSGPLNGLKKNSSSWTARYL